MEEKPSKQILDSKIELEIISKEKNNKNKKPLFDRQSFFNYLKVIFVILLGSSLGVGFMFLVTYLF